MKRLPKGTILIDRLDIICISFSFGSSLAYFIRKYKKRKRNVDPIVAELKASSRVMAISTDGKPLVIPLMRGGETLKGLSLVIKSKRLAILIRAIIYAKRKQKLFKLLQINFVILNALLTSSVGLRIAIGGSLDYTQFILIAFPATIGGFLMGLVIANPLASVLLPLGILYGRGIEDIPDPYERCLHFCKAAEEFHNKELAIEMKKLVSPKSPFQLDQGPLVCVEDHISLLERFKLRKIIEDQRADGRIQHFSKFIRNFSECDADPEAVYERVVEKVTE